MNRNIKDEILRLKEERNAIILAHYYVNDELQEIADYVGDSYFLSKVGRESNADIIVFCGVKFMAESAKILSPNKRVFLPSEKALCGMALMAKKDSIEKIKEEHPKAKVVCYVNSSSEVKAVSDVCCTSSSALNIVKNIESDEIIFVPDRNLGSYVQEQLPYKKVILWDGCCHIHDSVTKEQVVAAKEKYGNDVKVLVHPECRKEVRDLADFTGSTGGMIKYVSSQETDKFLVVTDIGILYKLKHKNPNKKFFTLDMACPSMKIMTLEDVYVCIRDLKNEIFVDEEVQKEAYKALNNMHELNK